MGLLHPDLRMTPLLPPAFLRLAWANLAAQSAEQLSLAAVPIVAVLALNAGAGEIGLLATVQTLPFLLLSIPLAMLGNILRVATLLFVAREWGAAAGFTYYHDYSGIFFFIGVLLLVYPLTRVLRFGHLRYEVI